MSENGAGPPDPLTPEKLAAMRDAEVDRQMNARLDELVHRANRVAKQLMDYGIPIAVTASVAGGTRSVDIQISGPFLIAVGELLVDALRSYTVEPFDGNPEGGGA